MRKILAVIILSLFLPFLSFADEAPPATSNSPSYNIFDSLRNVSTKIESYVTPESAKEKGLWAWIQESSRDLLNRAIRSAKTVSEFIKNKGQAAFNFIENKIKEKIGESIWSSGETYIKNSMNYIDNKIKN